MMSALSNDVQTTSLTSELRSSGPPRSDCQIAASWTADGPFEFGDSKRLGASKHRARLQDELRGNVALVFEGVVGEMLSEQATSDNSANTIAANQPRFCSGLARSTCTRQTWSPLPQAKLVAHDGSYSSRNHYDTCRRPTRPCARF